MNPSNSLNLTGNLTPPNNNAQTPTTGNSFNLLGNITPPNATTASIGNTVNSQITPTTPINPAAIQNSPASGSVVTAPPPPSTNPSAFVNSITPPPSQNTPSSTQSPTDTTTGNTTSNEIDNLMQELGYKSNDVSQLQQSAGIPGIQNSIQDLSTQLAQKKAMYDNSFQKIGAQNIPSVFVSGQMALQRQAAAVDLGATAAQLQAAQGNLSSAFNTIKQTIDQKYSAIQDSLNAKLQFYELNRDKFTPDQQKRADRLAIVLGVDKNRAELEKSNMSDAVKNIQTAITNGNIDPAEGYKIIGDLVNGNITSGDAYTKAGLTQPTGSAGNGNEVVDNTLKLIGTTGDQTVQQAINQVGLDKIIAGIVAQEGGTPQGTNNPGNIKYVGQPGATKGKEASDGGNFANFNTPQDFQNAITKLVTNHASDNLSDFIASYKGVSLNSKPEYAQYGLLANVDGFNPSSIIDKGAKDYLDAWLKSPNGALPTATQVLGSSRGNNAALFLNVQNRAKDLYYKATGEDLPDLATFQNNKKLINMNEKILNNQAVLADTIKKNFDLAINGEISGDVNKNAPIINKLLNPIKAAIGDTATAQALVSNGTISQEFANLLSIRNNGGTLASDKVMAEDLIPFGTSVQQQKGIVQRLEAEATNIHSALQNQNAALYKKIDPLELSSSNPNRQSTLSNVPKGNMSSNDYVEKVLSSQGLKYDDVISKIPQGMEGVIDNVTGQIGYIPSSELDPNKYTHL